MADTTPIYGLRYQELGDSPNGAGLGQNLAEDVEAQLTLVYAQLALLNAKPISVAAACSVNLDLTTTETDVAGATVTFTTTKANARYVCTGSFYMGAVTGGTAVASGKLSVDGVVATAKANFTGIDTNARASVSQTWRGTLASAGSHTLKLRGVASAMLPGTPGAGAFRINTADTVITVTVFES